MTAKKTAAQRADADHHLILMRHAKSDWSDGSLDDFDRPLNGRGRRDSPRMAAWLAELDLVPDVILSSSSARTRETIALMMTQWSTEPVIDFRDALYLSAPETILQEVQEAGGDSKRLMVLAHNPGMTHLVSDLSQQAVDMPTAAIAIFELSLIDWSQLQAGTPMSLVNYMRPKAL